jgi:hypothetical protein
VLVERLPRRRLELVAQDLQRPPEQLPAILLLLEKAVVRGRHVGQEGLAGAGRRPRLPLDLIAPAVQDDGFEPGAEAVGRVVLEARQLLQQGDEHVLHQVARVAFVEAGLPRPAEQQRAVQVDEPRPGRLVGRMPKPLQEADGRGVHGTPSLALPPGAVNGPSAVSNPLNRAPGARHVREGPNDVPEQQPRVGSHTARPTRRHLHTPAVIEDIQAKAELGHYRIRGFGALRPRTWGRPPKAMRSGQVRF